MEGGQASSCGKASLCTIGIKTTRNFTFNLNSRLSNNLTERFCCIVSL